MTPNEAITIYYDPISSLGKKTRATAMGLTPYVREIDITREKMTTTRWVQLLNALDMEPKKLLNKSLPLYQSLIRGTSYDDQGWLNILVKYPTLLRGPIVVKDKRAILCDTPNDVYKLVRKTEVA